MSDPDTNEILFKAADGNSHKRIMGCQDAYETWHEHHGWGGKIFCDDIDSSKDQDIIDWLKSENAYLRGKIEVYEKFLKDRVYINEEE